MICPDDLQRCDRLDCRSGRCQKPTMEKAKAMPPECLERGATLVMAAPLAENRQRWIRELRATFATCEVNERRMLQQVIVNLQPNVLVVDLSLPALGGLSEIRRWSPATKW